MIPFEEALQTVLAQRLSLATETVALEDALGRFLAGKVHSPIDAPPFTKSAMDGYAVREDDIREVYRVREVIAAGDSPDASPLEDGEAAKIMTGAPLPPGAGRVIRVEYIEKVGDSIRVTQEDPTLNVIRKGENVRAGEELLAPCRIGPKEIGSLAAAGYSKVDVYRLVTVGVITTGSETAQVGTTLGPAQIFDSNGPQLRAQVGRAGALCRDYGNVVDDPAEVRKVAARAMAECDVVLFTGGVSKGDFDFVPGVLQDLGVSVQFHGVRVKPGRPTLFGTSPQAMVFGLPGNPVSVFVIFEVLVRPLLHAIQHAPSPGIQVRGTVSEAVRRSDAERAEFLPATLGRTSTGVALTPLPYRGSSQINALGNADALILIAAGEKTVEAGRIVDGLLI